MVAKPGGMSLCEVQQLQQDCVSQINTYRRGQPFSDGRTRDHGQLNDMQAAPTNFAKCMNEKALSDLLYSSHRGQGCGHFTSRLDCGLSIQGWGFAENSCCPRSCSSYQQCKDTLLGCLRQMWDEGQMVLDSGSTQWTVQTGHYWNMVRDDSTAACGFGFDSEGRMLATQNFY